MTKILLFGTAISLCAFPNVGAGEFDTLPRDNSDSYFQGKSSIAFEEIDANYVKNKNLPQTTQSTTNPAVDGWKAGDDWLINLKAEFRTGEWREFLADAEAEYNQLKKDASFTSKVNAKNNSANFAYSYSKLFEKTKKDLIQACADQSDTNICIAVDSVVNRYNLTAEQIQALDWLNKVTTGVVPVTDATDINIKKISQEYRLKRIALEKKAKENGVFPDENELAVLEFDKFNNLFDVTRGKEENAKINEAYQGFVNIAKSLHDMRYLIDLGRNNRTPANPAEQRVAQIMSKYVYELDQLKQQDFIQ